MQLVEAGHIFLAVRALLVIFEFRFCLTGDALESWLQRGIQNVIGPSLDQ